MAKPTRAELDKRMRELINDTETGEGEMLQALCRAVLSAGAIFGGCQTRPMLKYRIKEALDADRYASAAARLAYLCWMVETGQDPKL